MDVNQILGLASRWLHVIPVIILVGGTLFMRFSLVPAATETNASPEFREAVRKRWARLVMFSILFLLVTGLYNAVTKIMAYEVPKMYHHLVLVKLLVGLLIFYFASRLSGRSEKAAAFRTKELKWLNILCVLMLFLVLVAGYMKFISTDAPKKIRGEVKEVSTTQLIHERDSVENRSQVFSTF